MTLPTLTEEQGVVLTVLLDCERRGEGPGTVEEIAAATGWPGARTFGVDRTRRVLRDLARLGLAHRTATRRFGVRWEAGQHTQLEEGNR